MQKMKRTQTKDAPRATKRIPKMTKIKQELK